MFGAVFGLSSVLGPLLGAIITDSIGWHWVFYINVPIGIVSVFLIARYYQESLDIVSRKSTGQVLLHLSLRLSA